MELNIIQTLSLLIIFLVIGYTLQKGVKVLRDSYVPAPVIGGLLFSIVLAIAKNYVTLKLDFSALPIFVAGFFLSIGLRIDFATFKKNLKLQLLFLFLVIMVALMQNVVSLGIGKGLGKSSYDIIISGSLGLMGDHTLGGLVPSFLEGGKPVMQSLTSLSILTLYIGSIVGGLFFKKLKNKVDLSKNLSIPAPSFTPQEFLQYILIFVVGIAISLLPTQYGFSKYINPAGGGFILGLILRWIFDDSKVYEVKAPNVNLIGNFCLSMLLITTFSMFDITMIFKVSLYNLVLMIIQLAWLIALSYYLVFKLYKKNPLASYVATGLIGFSVGMPASTMSNLQCLTEREGALPIVLFVVPPVGAWIINIFNMCIIKLFL
ncbi:sodium--glutamate symport carrier (gltS) [Clostridium putrefaciens]|uniref:Sodium--glutamate symport carrier (GltS) n=1 Tax=Clostridium putrefaciens TaxID=99675 RepID=A0A381JDC9_9CLOT|nr:sodium/glutamate symporter [Clostridium putrefaciens]SUY48417.1 sodium--glutamate symport carrier (gltS) [Clostridium putrefaciens]